MFGGSDAAFFEQGLARKYAQQDQQINNTMKLGMAQVAASKANADRAARASEYGSKVGAEASMYGANKSAEASMYGADKQLEGTMYASDNAFAASKYGSDASMSNARTAADASMYGAELGLAGQKYASDNAYSASVYGSNASMTNAQTAAAASKYSSDNARAASDYSSRLSFDASSNRDATLNSMNYRDNETARKVMPYKRGIARVPGSGSGDKVPAMLEPGEAVLNKHAAGMIGRDKIASANKKGNDLRSKQNMAKIAQAIKMMGMA